MNTTLVKLLSAKSSRNQSKDELKKKQNLARLARKQQNQKRLLWLVVIKCVASFRMRNARERFLIIVVYVCIRGRH